MAAADSDPPQRAPLPASSRVLLAHNSKPTRHEEQVGQRVKPWPRRQRLRAPRAPPTSGGSILTEKRRKVGDGFQEQLRVHRLVRRQRLELVVQQKSHGPAVGKERKKKRSVARQSRAALACKEPGTLFFFFFLFRWEGKRQQPLSLSSFSNRWGILHRHVEKPTHEHDNELVEV